MSENNSPTCLQSLCCCFIEKPSQKSISKSDKVSLQIKGTHYEQRQSESWNFQSQNDEHFASEIINQQPKRESYQQPFIDSNAIEKEFQQQNTKQNTFRENQLFFLKSTYSKFKLIAKVTHKHEKGCSQTIERINSEHSLQEGSFQNDFLQSTPNQLAKYIATRAQKYPIILELGFGTGANTFQFALQGDLVISIEKNPEKIETAKMNCSSQTLALYEKKVDFIIADLSKVHFKNIHHERVDLVFMHPNVKKEEKFDLFKDCSPSIFKLMEIAFNNSTNIILELPKGLDIYQLPILLEYFQQILQDQNFSLAVEIEFVFVNKKIEFYLIYIGNIANISEVEICSLLQEQISFSGSEFEGFDYTEHLHSIINLFLKKCGMIQLLNLIEDTKLKLKPQIPFFQQFINNGKRQKIIEINELYEIVKKDQESEKHSETEDKLMSSYFTFRREESQKINSNMFRTQKRTCGRKESVKRQQSNIQQQEDFLASLSEYSLKSSNPENLLSPGNQSNSQHQIILNINSKSNSLIQDLENENDI